MLVENGFTIGALSREYLLRTFGKVIADEVYPQDRERKISKKSNDFSMVVTKIIADEITENGYIVVNEIKDRVQEVMGTSANRTDYKYRQVEPEIIGNYTLKKISLTNALREELEITHLKPNARPKILVSA